MTHGHGGGPPTAEKSINQRCNVPRKFSVKSDSKKYFRFEFPVINLADFRNESHAWDPYSILSKGKVC